MVDRVDAHAEARAFPRAVGRPAERDAFLALLQPAHVGKVGGGVVDAVGEVLVDAQHGGQGLGVLGLGQRAAVAVAGEGGRVQAGQAEGQAQPFGARLGQNLGLGDHALLFGAHREDTVHRRQALVDRLRRQHRGGTGHALEILEDGGQGRVAAFDRLGQVFQRTRAFGHVLGGDVEAGLAVGDPAFRLGLHHAHLGLGGRALGQGEEQGDAGRYGQPEHAQAQEEGDGELRAGLQDDAAGFAMGTDIQVSFRKERLHPASHAIRSGSTHHRQYLNP